MIATTTNRPVLAYLRPHETLSDYEMGYVLLLEDEFHLRVITTGRVSLGSANDIPGLVRLSWPDEIPARDRNRSLLNAVYARVLGRRYHIPGLEPALAGARIVQASEAASECSYQAARLKDRLGFKLLLSASENQIILAGRTPGQRDRIRFTLSKVDRAFAIPAAGKERLIEAGMKADHITVIGHGIDCERFSPGESAETGQDPGRAFRVGYCGRFRREKGLEHLIAATRDLNLDLVLLGDGPERDRLEVLAHARTTIRPPLPYARIHSFYREIDCFVLPSVPVDGLVEQYGFVLLEAMASGVPIVASAIGGIPEVVADRAILVPPGDESALRNAIERVRSEPSLQMSLAALGVERARALFRREIVAEKMRAVYRELLAEG
jgi:glycosyltransferase involved in cell wall biosynthesis